MTKVNAIDLDDTLIPYDSMRRFYFIWLWNWRYFLQLLWLLVLRKSGVYNRGIFSEKFHQLIKNDTQYQEICNKFGNEIAASINLELLEVIKSKTDADTINILVTASPEDYCYPIVRKLNWQLIGSGIKNGTFYHNYGENKIKLLQSLYPVSNYNYNYAVSDSPSDMDLLKLFEDYCLYKI